MIGPYEKPSLSIRGCARVEGSEKGRHGRRMGGGGRWGALECGISHGRSQFSQLLNFLYIRLPIFCKMQNMDLKTFSPLGFYGCTSSWGCWPLVANLVGSTNFGAE